jgi:AraC-like DNA-binding protein
MSCATFREALQFGTKYQRVVGRFSGRQLMMSFFQEDDIAVIQIDDDPAISEFRVFAIEEIFGCTMGQSRWVTGKPLQLISVHCRYSATPYQERYQQVFRCPVYFDEPYNQLRFDASLLDDPLPQASSHSASIYRSHCDEMAAEMDSVDDELVLRVRQAILSHPKACPGSKEVAAKLCISERSLRRKLKDSGVCLQQILDEIRLGIAKEYLTTSRRSIENIAQAVGFDDPTSFSRAFKRWAGVSPRQFRGKMRVV